MCIFYYSIKFRDVCISALPWSTDTCGDVTCTDDTVPHRSPLIFISRAAHLELSSVSPIYVHYELFVSVEVIVYSQGCGQYGRKICLFFTIMVSLFVEYNHFCTLGTLLIQSVWEHQYVCVPHILIAFTIFKILCYFFTFKTDVVFCLKTFAKGGKRCKIILCFFHNSHRFYEYLLYYFLFIN